eukprot:366551-Chlamydomonas_euryale.AAC.43
MHPTLALRANLWCALLAGTPAEVTSFHRALRREQSTCTLLHPVAPRCTLLHPVAPRCTLLHPVAPCCGVVPLKERFPLPAAERSPLLQTLYA